MVVAATALEGQAEERRAGELDGVLQPDVAIEDVIVAAEEAGCSTDVAVAGSDLIGREHFDNHPVVAFVSGERFDDPVSPAPDVPARIAKFVAAAAAVPIAVTPDVHPMPSPAARVLRRFEQPVHDSFVGIRFVVVQELMQLIGCRWQAAEVDEDSPQQRRLVGFGQGSQAARFVFGGDEDVDRI